MRLHHRFAIAGSCIMLFGMLGLGSWVSSEIQQGVTNNSAISAAIYMESFIAPLSQELASEESVSPETTERLAQTFARAPLAGRIVSVKLWKPGGLIVFSTNPALIGQRFPPTDNLRAAWQGKLSADFDDLSDDENELERRTGVPLLEVYNPIHSIFDGEVIAVAEFYQDARELKHDLADARLNSWVIVAAVALATFGLLYGIVKNGSNIIDRQHRELRARLGEVAAVSRQNEALRRRIQHASLRSSEMHERFLRRVSAELHDGPAQALALASLRLDSLASRADRRDEEEVQTIRQALAQSLGDIRNLCRGLSLPEIENKRLSEVLRIVISAHERLTRSTVRLDGPLADLDARSLDHSTLICVYRFVQEGLMNAFRHGGAAGQRVACAIEDDALRLTVEDEGPGFDAAGQPFSANSLGLMGLRERIESVGGEFMIDSAPGRGVRLVMTLNIGA
ncbi:MAG: sensor histidine kinase [Alphaproteobacteria bacterium]